MLHFMTARTVRPFLRVFVASALALAFLMSSALPSLAVGGITGNLQGVIVDAQSQAPLKNVAISAASPAGRYSALTDAKGFFQINGMTVDTYTVVATAAGYEVLTLSGVTVQGDQTINLNTQSLAKRLTTIGRTSARSQSNVFQPSQTVDAVTISGTRATTATGKAAATDENALALSAPGVQLTNRGTLTVRGGLSNEVGYQFDGVNFQEPYLTNDAARGGFTGLGSLQVVAGAGDPSQGNVGSGILNFTVKRGARPSFGYVDLEVTNPQYGHQAGFEYGFASPNGRFSNYTTYIGQRFSPVLANRFADAASLNLYNSAQFATTDDVINNAIYRFGKDNNQSLQFLYRNRYTQNFGDNGGIDGRVSALYNPVTLAGFTSQIPSDIAALPGFSANDFIRNTVYFGPYAPTTAAVTAPEISLFQPLRFIKLEYTNNLNASTYLALRTYNYESLSGGSNYSTAPVSPNWGQNGGKRAGIALDLTKSFGDKHTVTVGGLLENSHPVREEYRPADLIQNVIGGVGNGGVAGGSGSPSFYDFLTPANSTQAISATNPCPIAGACYIYNQLGANGKTLIPSFGVNYTNTDYQAIAGYIRDQFTATRKLKLDVGLRIDHENFKQGFSPYNTDLANPTDVDTSFVDKKFTQPTVTEPRIAAVYQFSNSDSLRAGYGRSVEFASAQTFGTPGFLYGLDQRLFGIAPLPGTNTSDPATWTCGSGYNAAQIVKGGANAAATGGGFFQCKNYAQQLYWITDQTLDAPDVGNNSPPTYTNIDLTYQKQLKNGVGLRLTGYTKRGYNLPSLFLINQFTDVNTGAITAQVFAVSNLSINRTTGLEFGLSLPDKPFGLTGYLSATYSNVFNSNPPLIAGEDLLPLVSKASLALGNVYRAGYVSPFVINAGASYKTRNGFRINPIVNYDRGYPIGAGNTTASGSRQAAGFLIDGQFRTIPQTNLDQATVPSYRSGYFENAYTPSYRGSYTATNYVDPVNPGSYYSPYIAATRGTPESASAGGVLSRPRLQTDLSLEYARNKNTFGVLVKNLIGSKYSEPTLNPLYQPVATGVAGPLTGQRSQGNPASAFYNLGTRNLPDSVFNHSPYIEIPNNPTTFRFYYQIAL
ncbi:MAG: hypothetical protein NVSMB5_07640 [Candidatus Velthaea sp.]